jgi:hypothetical protein
MVCNSLECIHGDFHSLVFPGTDLEKRQGNDDWIWCYDDYVYSGFGTNMEVADMICFTEQQKQEIVHTGMLVVKFKQSIMKASVALKEVFEFVKDALRKLADRISKNLWMTPRKYQGLLPKEKFKTIRRLDKCGYTEKEINLMVGGVYHCRNNC